MSTLQPKVKNKQSSIYSEQNMGKNKREDKNKKQNWLHTETGKRFINFAYGIGAAVVIIGAMLKLIHHEWASVILTVGMTTEAIILVIAAFDPPNRTYNWEEVFPVLDSGDDGDRPKFADGVQLPNSNHGAAASNIEPTPAPSAAASTGGYGGYAPIITPSQALGSFGLSVESVSATDTMALTNSIQKITHAADSISHVADSLSLLGQSMPQIQMMVENLSKMSQASGLLSDASMALTSSYKEVAESSESIGIHSRTYSRQMESLTRNLTSLNHYYETQVDTLEKVNLGLSGIKDRYLESANDSKRFREETDKLVQQLAELNTIYNRMLKAMIPPYFGGVNKEG